MRCQGQSLGGWHDRLTTFTMKLKTLSAKAGLVVSGLGTRGNWHSSTVAPQVRCRLAKRGPIDAEHPISLSLMAAVGRRQPVPPGMGQRDHHGGGGSAAGG